jgi:hypothetical protein
MGLKMEEVNTNRKITDLSSFKPAIFDTQLATH